jgi:hypothetical protein
LFWLLFLFSVSSGPAGCLSQLAGVVFAGMDSQKCLGNASRKQLQGLEQFRELPHHEHEINFR